MLIFIPDSETEEVTRNPQLQHTAPPKRLPDGGTSVCRSFTSQLRSRAFPYVNIYSILLIFIRFELKLTDSRGYGSPQVRIKL